MLIVTGLNLITRWLLQKLCPGSLCKKKKKKKVDDQLWYPPFSDTDAVAVWTRYRVSQRLSCTDLIIVITIILTNPLQGSFLSFSDSLFPPLYAALYGLPPWATAALALHGHAKKKKGE